MSQSQQHATRDLVMGIIRKPGGSFVRSVARANLTPSERMVLVALAEFLPNIEPSIATLAAMTGGTKRMVMRTIQSLERKGAITVDRLNGVRSRYRITLSDVRRGTGNKTSTGTQSVTPTTARSVIGKRNSADSAGTGDKTDTGAQSVTRDKTDMGTGDKTDTGTSAQNVTRRGQEKRTREEDKPLPSDSRPPEGGLTHDGTDQATLTLTGNSDTPPKPSKSRAQEGKNGGKAKKAWTCPGHAELIAHYKQEYTKARGEEPTIGSAVGRAARDLLAVCDLSKARTYVTRCYEPGSYWRGKATLMMLATDPDKYGRGAERVNGKNRHIQPDSRPYSELPWMKED